MTRQFRWTTRPLLFSLVFGLFVVISVTTSAAWGQCAVCGNPAFAVGDNDIDRSFTLDQEPSDTTIFRANVRYTQRNFFNLATGSKLIVGEEKKGYLFTPDWALNVHVMTLALDAELATGTGLSITLPYVVAAADRYPDDSVGDRTDSEGNPLGTSHDWGPSDAEVRIRQRLTGNRGLWLRGGPSIVVSAGYVAPTGSFIAKDGSGALPAGYASVGRGVHWAVGDVEAAGTITGQLRFFGAISARTPLTNIDYKGFLFHWGTEVRSQLQLQWAVASDVAVLALGVQHLARGQGLERVFAESDLEPFPNGGGQFWTLQPAVWVALPAKLAASLAVRLPLARDVNGIQPVPGIGGVFSIASRGL